MPLNPFSRSGRTTTSATDNLSNFREAMERQMIEQQREMEQQMAQRIAPRRPSRTDEALREYVNTINIGIDPTNGAVRPQPPEPDMRESRYTISLNGTEQRADEWAGSESIRLNYGNSEWVVDRNGMFATSSGGGTISEEDYLKEQTKKKNAKEREAFKEFMATGIPGQLSVFATDEKVWCTSRHTNDGNLLFVIEGDVMKVPKKRTSHMLAILKKLAEREGLTLERESNMKSVKGGQRVLFWEWKVQEVIDDSKLMEKTKPLLNDTDCGESEDYCGDPNCVACNGLLETNPLFRLVSDPF